MPSTRAGQTPASRYPPIRERAASGGRRFISMSSRRRQVLRRPTLEVAPLLRHGLRKQRQRQRQRQRVRQSESGASAVRFAIVVVIVIVAIVVAAA
jgi:hypothetical protein